MVIKQFFNYENVNIIDRNGKIIAEAFRIEIYTK